MRLEDFFRPVEELSDRELVEQARVLRAVQERRRRRREGDTARRLIESLDDPDEFWLICRIDTALPAP